jgi:hypothetical protein
MGYDQKKLIQILTEMRNIYFKDPGKATTSQSFIKTIHKYCEHELKLRGIDSSFIHLEKPVSGSHSEKNVDIVIMGPQNKSRGIATGPLITISVKSQMSSINKNFQTVYDRIIGEVLNLHNRFPLLVANCLYLYPVHGYTKPKSNVLEGRRIQQAIQNCQLSNPLDYIREEIDFEKLSRKYALTTGRKDPSDFPDKHEHFAFLVVDFDRELPAIRNDLVYDPILLIDNFFDKIYKDYIKRNASFL